MSFWVEPGASLTTYTTSFNRKPWNISTSCKHLLSDRASCWCCCWASSKTSLSGEAYLHGT